MTPYSRPAVFLAEAGAPDDFAARALNRINSQDEELGESYLWSSLALLVREIREEAVDIAAWSALLAHRLERDPVDTGARQLLADVVALGARADALVGDLELMLGVNA